MSLISIVHPTDGDLRFLKKLIRDLNETSLFDVDFIKLTKEYRSHNIAKNKIESIEDNRLLCFLCHGRSDGLYSCRYRPNNEPNLQYVLTENKGLLIHKGNISLFNGKKIFCLACKSNGIGALAIENGAKVFIGFDDINFDLVVEKIRDEGTEEKHYARLAVEQKTKYILRYCVYHALKQGFINQWTFYQFSDYLKLCLDKLSDTIILNNKAFINNEPLPYPKGNVLKNTKCSKHAFHYYYESTAICIQEIKDGLKVWGDGNLPLSNFN